MSDSEAPKADEKKKGGKGKLLLLIAGALVIGGGGVGGGLYAAGMVGGGSAEPKVDRPKLVPKEGADPSEDELHPAEGKSPDPAKFQASYLPMPDPFTANLADTDGFVQLGLGVSTYYDSRVLDAVKTHEMALRSAVLMTLSEQDSLALSEAKGKQALRRDLKRAMNAVLKEKEGFGGIDDVYFTSFVIQ